MYELEKHILRIALHLCTYALTIGIDSLLQKILRIPKECRLVDYFGPSTGKPL